MEKAVKKVGNYLVQIGFTQNAGYEAEIRNLDGILKKELSGYASFDALWDEILKTVAE
jgi:hypothetical protein